MPSIHLIPHRRSCSGGCKTDFILEEGDVIAGRLRLVASPGHDDDCVCFYDIPTKTLISGDSLQGNGTRTQERHYTWI